MGRKQQEKWRGIIACDLKEKRTMNRRRGAPVRRPQRVANEPELNRLDYLQALMDEFFETTRFDRIFQDWRSMPELDIDPENEEE
jgi:hypothetical protein